jgi:hypothetical protein
VLATIRELVQTSYTIYKKDGVKRDKLTIGTHYTASGVRSVTKKNQSLMQQIKREQEYIDEVSHRSPTFTLSPSIERYLEVYDALWKQKLRKVWARGRFRTYIGKPKAMDAYFRRLKADGAGIRKAFIGRRQMVAVSQTRDRPVDFTSRDAFEDIIQDDQENVCETRWDHRTLLAVRKSCSNCG